MMVEIITKLLQ